jgi:hypothetical protein
METTENETIEIKKSKLELIKDNLNVILLVPTVMGGLWQLFELFLIDPSFVRFFSFSQVVPDGIIMLFIFTMIYGMYYFLFSMYKNETQEMKEKHKKEKGFIIFILVVYTAIFISLITLPIFGKQFRTFELFLSTVAILAIMFSILTLNESSEKFKEFTNKIYKSFIFVIGILIGGTLLIVYGLIFFHQTYFLPFNLKNVENIKCYLNKKSDEFEIRYFNDKYIFVELKDSIKRTEEELRTNPPKIEIINFEELLNKDNCK